MAAFAKRYLQFREPPYGRKEPLLWPVHVYRVLYPEVFGKELNLFQRAVLGLARAGCQASQEMSDLLGLHLQMVLLILAQCNSNGWIDSRGRITENGIALLDDDEDRNLNLRAGLLFRDAMSDSFWPRIVDVDDFNEIEALPGTGERPVFRQSRSSGKDIRPYLLNPSQQNPSPVDSREILEAYRAYRLDHFNARQLYGANNQPLQVRAQGIELMDELPEPMYVLTWITEDASGEKPWRLCDPFDLRQQVPWLEGSFKGFLPHQPLLVKKLAWLTGKPEPERQSIEEWMRSMEHAIDLELLMEHVWASREEMIARYYSSLKRRLLMIDQNLGSYELESTLSDAQKLCEAVCEWVLRAFRVKVEVDIKIRSHDRSRNEGILQALELPALTPKVVGILAGQDIRRVLGVLKGDRQSLKAMLFGALLSSLDYANHPFRKIAPENLALEQILRLADLRNEATHASGKEFEKEEVVQLGEFALNWTLQFKEWM